MGTQENKYSTDSHASGDVITRNNYVLCRNNRRCMVAQSKSSICAVVRRLLLLYLYNNQKLYMDTIKIWKQNTRRLPNKDIILMLLLKTPLHRSINHSYTSVTVAVECGCKVTFTFALSFGRYRCVWVRL